MEHESTPPPTTWSILGAATRNRRLRRLLLIYACFKTAELGGWIAITTIAYVAGGVNLATVVLVVQLAPATLAALGVERAITSVGPERVLVSGLVAQTLGLAGVSVLAGTGGPLPLLVASAAVAATAVVTTRPALQTLLPTIVEEPHELTAANSVMGWVLGAATLVGPVITALTISSIGDWAPFALFAGLELVATVTAVSLRRRRPDETAWSPPLTVAGTNPGGAPADRLTPSPSTDLRAVWLMMLVIGAGGFLWGAIDVVQALVAIDLTDGPPERAAVMAAAFGAGSLVGGLSTVALIGRRHLWPAMALSAASTAAAMALVGATSDPVVAGALLALVGAASTAMIVAARTLLQRISDFDTVCRAFSLAEATEMGTLLLGSMVIPFLVAGVGDRWAPAVVGGLVAVAALVASRAVAGPESLVADRIEVVVLLRRTTLLATLPAPALELLARNAERSTVPAGTTVVAEGEFGDHFYVVESGAVRVRRGEEHLRDLHAGDGFGEIALLLDRPRTATVETIEDCSFVVLGRALFITAVTGHAPSHGRAHELAQRHALDDYENPPEH